jgi:hypothetical protein
VNDVKDRRFGLLVVEERVGADGSGHVRWRCRCDCGGEAVCRSVDLRRGHSTSCGCKAGHRFKKRHVPEGEIGGRYVNGIGYVKICVPWHPDANADGWMYEHRFVMEKKIGRRLKPEEVVHHDDGDRANNHPENLTLFANEDVHKKWHVENDVNGAYALSENASRDPCEVF